MKKIFLLLAVFFFALKSFGQIDEWGAFGPWTSSECFYVQHRVKSYYDSKKDMTSFQIEYKNNYSKAISFKDVNFADVREAHDFFRNNPPSGGTQSNINLGPNETRVYRSRRDQKGKFKQTYIYIYHLEMDRPNRGYSACVNGEPCIACSYNAVSSCPNYKSKSSDIGIQNQAAISNENNQNNVQLSRTNQNVSSPSNADQTPQIQTPSNNNSGDAASDAQRAAVYTGAINDLTNSITGIIQAEKNLKFEERRLLEKLNNSPNLNPEAIQYFNKYKKYNKISKKCLYGGLGLTGIGCGVLLLGASDLNLGLLDAGMGIAIGGAGIMLLGGIPTSIKASVNFKRAQSFVTTIHFKANGVGLAIHF